MWGSRRCCCRLSTFILGASARCLLIADGVLDWHCRCASAWCVCALTVTDLLHPHTCCFVGFACSSFIHLMLSWVLALHLGALRVLSLQLASVAYGSHFPGSLCWPVLCCCSLHLVHGFSWARQLSLLMISRCDIEDGVLQFWQHCALQIQVTVLTVLVLCSGTSRRGAFAGAPRPQTFGAVHVLPGACIAQFCTIQPCT
jgi:hypothetical protein